MQKNLNQIHFLLKVPLEYRFTLLILRIILILNRFIIIQKKQKKIPSRQQYFKLWGPTSTGQWGKVILMKSTDEKSPWLGVKTNSVCRSSLIGTLMFTSSHKISNLSDSYHSKNLENIKRVHSNVNGFKPCHYSTGFRWFQLLTLELFSWNFLFIQPNSLVPS